MPEPFRDRHHRVWLDPLEVSRLCAVLGLETPATVFEDPPWRRFDQCRTLFCGRAGYLTKWGTLDYVRARAAGVDVSFSVRERFVVTEEH